MYDESMDTFKQKLILIIDKHGYLGNMLAKAIIETNLIVLVSTDYTGTNQNIIHLPYHTKIPAIPDNTYARIIVCYSGEEEILDMLPSLAKKAHESSGQLFFLLPLSLSKAELFHRLAHHLYHDMRIFVVGELFRHDVGDSGIISQIFRQVAITNSIHLSHDGLTLHYPILLDDVLSEVLSLIFEKGPQKRIQYLFPHYPVSELTIARLIKKHHPEVIIDFTANKKQQPVYYFPPDGVYVYSNYPLEEKIAGIPIPVETKPPIPEATVIVAKEHHNERRSFLFLGVAVGVFVFPFLLTLASLGIGFGLLSFSFSQLKQGEFAASQNAARGAQVVFSVGEITQQVTGLMFFMSTYQHNILISFSLGKQLSQLELDSVRSASLLRNIQSGISVNPRTDFFQVLSLTKKSLLSLQKMKAEKVLPAEIDQALVDADTVLTPLANTIDTFPQLFGFEGKKRYLVLFQNNMELRPGGGFIGSYGLLTFENGRIIEFTVHDVYDADGKLTQHYEPPFGLRRYLGASHWFLRDSNFSPDFLENSKQAAIFLQSETGERVDGVFAIDTTFLKNILAAVGDVSVPEYHETVTPETFYLITQTHAEKDFFPGSTQKKDFLQSLLTAMRTKLSGEKNVPFAKLVKAIGSSLQGKHVLFSFTDQQTQTVFTVNNLSGALWDGRTRTENEILDSLGINEANLGANKVNYYLHRSIEQRTALTERGEMATRITIVYTNTSEKSSPFGGDYKNFLRLLVPQGMALEAVELDGENIVTTPAIIDPDDFTKEGFRPPSALEVEKTTLEGKTVFGFLLTVPAGKSKKVTVVYTAANFFDPSRPTFSYDLKVIKQPGIQDDPYALFLSYPTTFILADASKEVSDVGGKLIYSTYLTQDKQIHAVFSKK
jgi:hypothetical protein